MREDKLINKRLYDFAAGGYCGVLMPEKVMKRLAKLNAKYSAEIRKVLNDHIDDIYPSEWTLANEMDGDKIKKQITISYTLKTKTRAILDRRIKLFQAPLPIYKPKVFIVDSHDEAKIIAEEILKEKLCR